MSPVFSLIHWENRFHWVASMTLQWLYQWFIWLAFWQQLERYSCVYLLLTADIRSSPENTGLSLDTLLGIRSNCRAEALAISTAVTRAGIMDTSFIERKWVHLSGEEMMPQFISKLVLKLIHLRALDIWELSWAIMRLRVSKSYQITNKHLQAWSCSIYFGE